MNFEDMQKAWQSQDASAKVTINADALLKKVRRSQQQFRTTLFWRDVREVGVAAFLTWLFLHWAIRDREWALYLLALACAGGGLFMLADRCLQRKRRPLTNDSVRPASRHRWLQLGPRI